MISLSDGSHVRKEHDHVHDESTDGPAERDQRRQSSPIAIAEIVHGQLKTIIKGVGIQAVSAGTWVKPSIVRSSCSHGQLSWRLSLLIPRSCLIASWMHVSCQINITLVPRKAEIRCKVGMLWNTVRNVSNIRFKLQSRNKKCRNEMKKLMNTVGFSRLDFPVSNFFVSSPTLGSPVRISTLRIIFISTNYCIYAINPRTHVIVTCVTNDQSNTCQVTLTQVRGFIA